MPADLSLAVDLAVKVGLLVVGALIALFFERRSRLTVYYGHVGEFRLQMPPGQNDRVHTHTLIIRNAGRLAARNVRVPHSGALAPANIHVSVTRGVNYAPSILPAGEEEFVFPVLAPRQQVTISYLYFPPITYRDINLPITSDEGLAKELRILPTPQLPKAVLVVLWLLVLIGAVQVLYLVATQVRGLTLS